MSLQPSQLTQARINSCSYTFAPDMREGRGGRSASSSVSPWLAVYVRADTIVASTLTTYMISRSSRCSFSKTSK